MANGRIFHQAAILLAFLACTVWARAGALAIDGSAVLTDALDESGSGQVLELKSGDYILHLTGRAYGVGTPTIIRSADPTHPARITQLNLRDVAQLRLEHLIFDYSFTPGDASNFRPFEIIASQDITIADSVFDGDQAHGVSSKIDGFPTGFGLSIRQSTNIRITNNEIRNFARGLVISESSDLKVQGNNLYDLRSDGMDFAQVQRVSIVGNHIHDFARSPTSTDHPDMIQFWTSGTTRPSTDILILDNILNAGAGLFTQSIFMRNEQVDQRRAGTEMFYKNIAIIGNVIINAHLQGISIGETAGLTISNNALLHNSHADGSNGKAPLWIPQIRVRPAAQNVTIVRNITAKITGYEDQVDWHVAENLIVQDHGRVGNGLFYDFVFINAVRGDPSDLKSFAPLPGGPLDGTAIGPSLLRRPQN